MTSAHSSKRQLFTLNCDRLSTPIGDRFKMLLKVAGLKSIVQWSLASSAHAEMLIVDSASATSVPADAACVVIVAMPGTHLVHRGAKPLRQLRQFALAPDFTVSQLLDVLDLAGVHLMQQRTKGQVHFASTRSQVETYRLTRWVMPGGTFRNPRYITAMAALAQQPLTMEALLKHSSLSLTQAEGLLSRLTRDGVLHISQTAEPTTPANVSSTKPSLVAKISNWLRGRSFMATRSQP